MRALAIGRRRGVHDGGLLRLVEPVQVRHRRIEREEGVQRQRRRLAVEHQRAVAAQADPVGIADRRDRAQPVERAPQHDDEHARIAAFRPRELRHLAPGEQGCRRRSAPRGGWADGGKGHAHLLWNSADMNSSTSACWRLSARRHRLLHL